LISVVIAVVMLLGACSHEEQATLDAKGRAAIGRFGETLELLGEAASLTGGSGPPEQVAPVPKDGVAIGATFVLDRIAEARRDVLISALGDSGPAAVLRAAVLEIANARRRIAEMAGATPDGPGRFSLPAPAKVVVLTDVTEKQLADEVEQLDLQKNDVSLEQGSAVPSTLASSRSRARPFSPIQVPELGSLGSFPRMTSPRSLRSLRSSSPSEARHERTGRKRSSTGRTGLSSLRRKTAATPFSDGGRRGSTPSCSVWPTATSA
jgi:hypothetical protein